MRVLVCGSRHFHDYEFVRNKVVSFCKESYENETLEIISGMAKGADTCAVDFALVHNVPLHKFPADWDTHGKKAGPIRNYQMLKEGKPDLVVAFLAPNSRGTKHMIEIATKAGIPVEIINVG